ncbi:hypothetical protein EDF51_106117 [Curtobacterium sp. PhB25]|nr:hypothetical protein EDF51_106117 [Curtobacterium sp. PhB25]
MTDDDRLTNLALAGFLAVCAIALGLAAVLVVAGGGAL